MRIRLSDEDRKTYGVDDALEYDLARCSTHEAAALQSIGYDSPNEWAVAIARTAYVTVDGWHEIYNGPKKQRETDDGPVPIEPVDYVAWGALVWLALRRAGHRDLTFADCDVDVRGLAWEAEPEVGAGKDPSTRPDPSP